MLYVVSQIVVSLAVAAFLGVAIGWWIRSNVAASAAQAADDDLDRAQREISELEAKLLALGRVALLPEGEAAASETDDGESRVLAAEALAEDASRELEEAHRRIEDLQQTTLAYKARMAKMSEEATILSPDVLSGALADERAAHARTRREFESLTAVHADCDFAFETLREQIVMLRDEVKVLKQRAAESRAPKLRAVPARTPAIATTQARALPQRPGTLLSSPDGVPDDLKQINGIGPRLEGILNELGVYHFQQVASLSADEARWLDAQLADYRGRLERDGWIEQARGLIEGRPHVKEF